ncbi:MAG TPA: hemolysin III family protein [Pyrinomonadaceae bacterium]|nr:hemolysin III family protein [Pyrinomonadaceae bacterium]
MTKPEVERLPVEEIANCVTHGIGLALSVVGMVALVLLAWLYGGTLHVVSSSVYGASLVTLYLASTLYHGARSPRAKHVFQVVDHCCIYLLIAGTYTPFTLVTLRGGWGWTLFGLVWVLSLAGIIFRIIFGTRYKPVTVVSYVLLGWLCVIAVKPILATVPLGALAWIAAGGLAYTSGVVFFAAHRIPHNHAIWHVFVLAGSICHFIAVALYVIPAKT